MDCSKFLVDNKVPTLLMLPCLIQNILDFVIPVSGVATAFFIVLSGIRFITSGGDQERVAGARKSVTFAVIGLSIIILSFVIIKTVSVLTGVECSVLGLDC